MTRFRPLLLCLAVYAPLAMASPSDIEFSAGRSLQPDDIDLSVTYRHLQFEYIDEGGQPHGIMTRDRPVNLDLIDQVPLVGRFSAFGKVGLTSSILSYGHTPWVAAKPGLLGQNFGAGIDMRLTDQFGAKLQWVRMHYPQVGVPLDEWFNYASLSVTYRL